MRISIIGVMAVLLCGASALPSLEDMQFLYFKYMTQFGKNYEAAEMKLRFDYFTKALAEIERLRTLNPEATFELNAMSDRSEAEMSAIKGYVAPSNDTYFGEAMPLAMLRAPSSVDWRKKGVVSPVKNQKHCGSCWAFAATEAIESAYALKGHSVPELSPQQIVSCSQRNGCQGGSPTRAYQYVEKAGGMETERAYPYTSGSTNSGGSCKFNKAKLSAVRVTGYMNAGRGSESTMRSALAAHGPMSVCLDAHSWQHYRGGVLTSCGRSTDHCVSVVGYTSDYWIVRNSWGTSFGDNGYIYLKMGSDMCGITGSPNIPTVA